LPFFKEQHGAVGHLLGGWGFSGNYVLASGQRYTPSQFFSQEFTGRITSTQLSTTRLTAVQKLRVHSLAIGLLRQQASACTPAMPARYLPRLVRNRFAP